MTSVMENIMEDAEEGPIENVDSIEENEDDIGENVFGQNVVEDGLIGDVVTDDIIMDSVEPIMTEVVEEKAPERVYGGCEGPEAMYVKLVSSDGHEFIVKREHALTSGTIKAMLSGPGQFAENEANEVNFREIP